MLLNLVKKDFILVKKYLLGMAVAAFVFPIFIQNGLGIMGGGILAFFISTFFIQLLLFSSVSMVEYKFKGSALLCATPYTRNLLVKAKYLFNLAVFVCCSVIYTIISFVWPAKAAMLHLSTWGLCLFIVTVVFGIIIPVQYHLGYEKAKYIFMCVIMATPFLLPNLFKFAQTRRIRLHLSLPLPPVVQDLLPYLLALVAGVLSMMISVNIYSKKQL